MGAERKKIVVLTGAGISAESGIKTFRDAGGLWEGHDVMEVASPQGWTQNMELVLDFYNQRRRQLLEVHPNAAHKTLVTLETAYDVTIVTQNVDDLHERAGSTDIIHLHGELLKARSTYDEVVIDCKGDIHPGDTCKNGFQLRPHIVWFGEAVPMLEKAAYQVMEADYIMVIGTSMQVYPAAGLTDYAQEGTHTYFIDPNPAINPRKDLSIYPVKATEGVPLVVNKLLTKV